MLRLIPKCLSRDEFTKIPAGDESLNIFGRLECSGNSTQKMNDTKEAGTSASSSEDKCSLMVAHEGSRPKTKLIQSQTIYLKEDKKYACLSYMHWI